MPAAQKLLFADPRPLVERLGRAFFLGLPQSPGVYLMRDDAGTVLYVGKARNLRKRLGCYRVANPERLPRRHLRLLRAVATIEIQEATSEQAALAREAELLRSLRPRFNRAGTWPSPPRFLAFNLTGDALHLNVISEKAAEPSQLCVFADPRNNPCWHGPHGAGARHLRNSLARLLWLILNPDCRISQLPVGWFHGSPEDTVAIRCGAHAVTGLAEISAQLEMLFRSKSVPFMEWVASKMPPGIPAFDKAVIESDLEFVGERFGAPAREIGTVPPGASDLTEPVSTVGLTD